jgi:hypothetical protein
MFNNYRENVSARRHLTIDNATTRRIGGAVIQMQSDGFKPPRPVLAMTDPWGDLNNAAVLRIE